MIVVPNSKKDVFLCTYDVNYDDGTYKTKALNSKNEEIFTENEQIEAVSCVDENGNLRYNQNVLKIQKEGKYGLINLEGKEILACEYDEITELPEVENTILISKDGNYGIVNEEGKIIIEPQYAEITNFGEEANAGFIVKNSEGKYGLVDITNNKVLETKYDKISKTHKGDYYVVTESGIQKVVKKDGTESLSTKNEVISILKNTEGVIYKTSDNKYGVMNLSSENIIEANYDELEEAKTGMFIAKKDNKYGIIDEKNETKLDFNNQSIIYNEKGDFYITEDENYNNKILNNNYETKLEGILTDIDNEKGYIELKQGEEYKYYNFKFEEQKEEDIFTNNTLFVDKKDGKYGLIDKKGKTVVEYIYDDMIRQNQFGYVAVKKDGKWGAIDRSGNVVQDPVYELDEYLKIDFIGTWYLGKDLNMNYYRK